MRGDMGGRSHHGPPHQAAEFHGGGHHANGISIPLWCGQPVCCQEGWKTRTLVFETFQNIKAKFMVVKEADKMAAFLTSLQFGMGMQRG